MRLLSYHCTSVIVGTTEDGYLEYAPGASLTTWEFGWHLYDQGGPLGHDATTQRLKEIVGLEKVNRVLGNMAKQAGVDPCRVQISR